MEEISGLSDVSEVSAGFSAEADGGDANGDGDGNGIEMNGNGKWIGGSKKEKKEENEREMIEVEEEWMGSKLKALTVYFGGLVGLSEGEGDGAGDGDGDAVGGYANGYDDIGGVANEGIDVMMNMDLDLDWNEL